MTIEYFLVRKKQWARAFLELRGWRIYAAVTVLRCRQ